MPKGCRQDKRCSWSDMTHSDDEHPSGEHLALIRSLPSYRALPPHGKDYVESVLRGPPARRVGAASLGSVSGSYVCPRFPYLVDYESAGCEKPFVLSRILDSDVVDLLSQPERITIVRTDGRGAKRPTLYTPDFMEFRLTQIALVEAKPKSDLVALSEQSKDWQYDTVWRYLPAEAAAARLGLSFYVFCPDELSATFKANLEVIARFEDTELTAKERSALASARRYLQQCPRTILELCERYSLSARVIYRAIAEGLLFGLVDQQQLEPGFVVYATEDDVQARIGRDEARTACATSLGPIHQRLLRASATELTLARNAQSRFDHRREQGLPLNATDYRDRAAQDRAAAEAAPRLAAFVRRVGDRGSRDRRIDQLVLDRMTSHALQYLKDGAVPNQSKMYADFTLVAEELGFEAPSQETHRRHLLAEIGPERLALISGGRRAFHSEQPPVDGALAVLRPPVGGLWVHIDGVFGDARSKKNQDGNFVRPIFFPMIDDVTGYVLSVGVRFGRPSRLPVLMAHRDCYLRHGFLPAQIIEDWGSEFENLLIPEMRAYFGVGYAHRPVGNPRFGGIGEMFNARLSSYLQELAGGTYFDKKGRSADGNKKSRATAKLSTREIVDRAYHWIFEIWNNHAIGAEKMTPQQRWDDSIKCFPEAVVPVTNDLLASYNTSLPLKASDFTYRDGFRFAGKKYASTELAALIRKGEVPTDPRLDCLNPTIVYALTSSGVIQLRSLGYQHAEGLTRDRLLHEMERTLTARSQSKANQFGFNRAEAKARRSPSVQEPLEPETDQTDTSPSTPAEAPRKIFPAVGTARLGRLRRAT